MGGVFSYIYTTTNSVLTRLNRHELCEKCKTRFIDNPLNDAICMSCKYVIEPKDYPFLTSTDSEGYVKYSHRENLLPYQILLN
jgi:hypothetical protein